MINTHSLLTLLCLFSLSMSINSARAMPVTWADNGHEYQVFFAPATSWSDARSLSQSLGNGWDLATITSLDEHNFITSLLGPLPNSGFYEYYIGGVFTTEWTWVTGEAFDFTYWGNGEPNGNANEPHIALDSRFNGGNWGWNDYTGAGASFVQGYIAERHTVNVAEPGSLFLLGLAALLFGLRRKNVSR